MQPYDPRDLTRSSPLELLVGGDWAIAHNHAATLAQVARALALRVRPVERRSLLDVARLADAGRDGAAARWYVATAGLRHRCRHPGPRRDDAAGHG